jgi:hypothetical protein
VEVDQASLTIFDWDDTLFATSALHPQNEKDIQLICKHYEEELLLLDA